MQISISNIVKGTVIGSAFTAISRYFTRVTQAGAIYEKPLCVESGINSSPLLQQASMLILPSGYKGGTAYAELPSNGNGDLTWTRASDAFRTNASGLIQRVPWNLLQYSEDFSNAAWQKTNSPTMTYNIATAPNGTTTADGIQDTTGGSYKSVNQLRTGITANSTFTYSIYVKKETTQTNFGGMSVFYSGGTTKVVYGIFNPINGTINFANSTLTPTSQIVDTGDYWRIIVTTTDTGSNTQVLAEYYATLSTNGTTLGQGIGSVRTIWGAQLVEGTTAQTYLPTTDRLNVPRLTYQNGGGGCPSLLLEKQSTNLVTYSNDFTDVSWVKSFTSITANTTTSPDGTTNAHTFTADGTSASHTLQKALSLTSGTTYSISIFAKKGTNNFIQLTASAALFGTNFYANYDLNNGVLGTVGSSATATIVSLSNGWYRCTITGVAIATILSNIAATIISSSTSTRLESNSLSTSVFIYGAQLEAGSYPTTYIPTTSSSATRVADACYKTGISSLIGQTEGTLFVDFVKSQDGNNYYNLSDGTNNNRIFIGQDSDLPNRLRAYVREGGNTASVDIVVGPIANGRYKMAIGYKLNDVVFYINGTLSGTDTSTLIPTGLTDLSLTNTTGGSASVITHTNQIALFKTRLTNAELATLTTL